MMTSKSARLFLAKLAKNAKGTLDQKLFWFKNKKQAVF